jgi:hypothetical protein
LRALELSEKKALYRFSKYMLVVLGGLLITYGCWFLISQYLAAPSNPEFWFGIFPAYIGSMMILISIAMKLEWFTDARKFW